MTMRAIYLKNNMIGCVECGKKITRTWYYDKRCQWFDGRCPTCKRPEPTSNEIGRGRASAFVPRGEKWPDRWKGSYKLSDGGGGLRD